MITLDENHAFWEHMIPSPNGYLEQAVDWIADNLMPENVFSREALAEWATANGFVAPAEDSGSGSHVAQQAQPCQPNDSQQASAQ